MLEYGRDWSRDDKTFQAGAEIVGQRVSVLEIGHCECLRLSNTMNVKRAGHECSKISLDSAFRVGSGDMIRKATSPGEV